MKFSPSNTHALNGAECSQPSVHTYMPHVYMHRHVDLFLFPKRFQMPLSHGMLKRHRESKEGLAQHKTCDRFLWQTSPVSTTCLCTSNHTNTVSDSEGLRSKLVDDTGSLVLSLACSLPVWSPCFSISLLWEQCWQKKRLLYFLLGKKKERSVDPGLYWWLWNAFQSLLTETDGTGQDGCLSASLFDVWQSPTLTGSDGTNWQGQKNLYRPWERRLLGLDSLTPGCPLRLLHTSMGQLFSCQHFFCYNGSAHKSLVWDNSDFSPILTLVTMCFIIM